MKTPQIAGRPDYTLINAVFIFILLSFNLYLLNTRNHYLAFKFSVNVYVSTTEVVQCVCLLTNFWLKETNSKEEPCLGFYFKWEWKQRRTDAGVRKASCFEGSLLWVTFLSFKSNFAKTFVYNLAGQVIHLVSHAAIDYHTCRHFYNVNIVAVSVR